MKKYNIIYLDPPWQFNNINTGGSLSSGSANQYPVLTLDKLKALPINQMADDNCLLAMWWVASQPQEALDLLKAWGFTLKLMTGFVWVKLTKNEKLHFGMGFSTRAGSECCLFAVKGKPKRVNASIRSVELVDFEEETFAAKVEEHSTKPDIFRIRLVELMGDIPRLEIFAREKPLGWDVLGLDVDHKDIFESTSKYSKEETVSELPKTDSDYVNFFEFLYEKDYIKEYHKPSYMIVRDFKNETKN